MEAVTQEAPGKAYNDNNVYIVGAGFGAEAGLPLIKNFMNRMRDAAAWLEDQKGRERELQAISRVLEFRLRAAAAAHRVPLNVENIEELFSLSSATAGEKLAEDMAWAIAATLDYARSTASHLAEHEYFSVGMLNVPGWSKPATWIAPVANIQQGVQSGPLKGECYGCPPYEFYVGVICGYFNKGGPGRKDTIITFNYDTLVEENLKALGVPYSYGAESSIGWKTQEDLRRAQRARNGIRVLKLHGSVNWCSELVDWAGRKEGLSEVPTGVATAKGRQISVYETYEALRGSGHAPLLVAPTWQKVLSGGLAEVWSDAVSALKTATNLIVLGYSIPATDQHFKYFLAAGLQDNISLRKVLFVNPALANDEAKQLLEDRLFALFRRELFDQGLIELVASDTRDFLAGPRTIGEESYRVRIGRPLNPPGYAWGTAPWTFFPPFLQGWSTA